MKRKVRLTESQLVGLIKRAINEQNQGKIESPFGGWCIEKRWNPERTQYIEGNLVPCHYLGPDGEPTDRVKSMWKSNATKNAIGVVFGLTGEKILASGKTVSKETAQKFADELIVAFSPDPYGDTYPGFAPESKAKPYNSTKKEEFVDFMSKTPNTSAILGAVIRPDLYPDIYKKLKSALEKSAIYLYTKNGPKGIEINYSDKKQSDSGSSGGGGYKSCTGTYKKGCSSEAIKKVQGCLGLFADGKFGPKTEAKLKSVDPKFATSFTDKDVETICNPYGYDEKTGTGTQFGPPSKIDQPASIKTIKPSQVKSTVGSTVKPPQFSQQTIQQAGLAAQRNPTLRPK